MAELPSTSAFCPRRQPPICRSGQSRAAWHPPAGIVSLDSTAMTQRRRGVSIGEALTQARQRAGLTVAQVSQQTRIRATIIAGIEGDDYSACGGDCYARGHIRAIDRAIGTDPERLARDYDEQQAPRPDAQERYGQPQ